jgi:hypothetical protein
VSIDAEKKELIGEYKAVGREWEPKGQPVRVASHDFPDPKVPRAYPYGVYDVKANEAFVSVGRDRETSAFAAETLRRWWTNVGQVAYPNAERLLICADAGGSNGYTRRLWKVELGRLAAETGLQITVCHLPPGTSKWNKSPWACRAPGGDEMLWVTSRARHRLDIGAQLNPATSLMQGRGTLDCRREHEPQIRFSPGPSPAGRSSTSSERRQQCSRSMSGSPGWTSIATVWSGASAGSARKAA